MLHLKQTTSWLLIAGLMTICGCAAKRSLSSNTNTPPPATQRETNTTRAAETKAPAEAGALKVGEASGSYVAKGETVNLKYAYAGRAQRFGEESVVILLTDKEIPPEALADEIKNQTMLLDGKIRGLEYAITKDGYWVRYHPSQYQESKSPSLKDYKIENEVVSGSDEDKGDVTDGKYSRSVKFVAAISK